MKNQEIRLAAGGSGVRLWQVAEEMGISEFTLSRKLRHELTDEDTKQILAIIQKIAIESRKES